MRLPMNMCVCLKERERERENDGAFSSRMYLRILLPTPTYLGGIWCRYILLKCLANKTYLSFKKTRIIQIRED